MSRRLEREARLRPYMNPHNVRSFARIVGQDRESFVRDLAEDAGAPGAWRTLYNWLLEASAAPHTRGPGHYGPNG